MRHPLRVLLIGLPGETLTQVEGLLSAHRQMLLRTRTLGNGGSAPLSELQQDCDATVLVLGEAWRATLACCCPDGESASKPLLVVGPAGDLELMRTAMRIGGRDFFSLPVSGDDLVEALDRLAREEHQRRGGLSARVTTFINAKGGSGASFFAANWGYLLAKEQRRRTMLLDFELQFGSLPTYFDLQSRNGLVRALELADSLDVAALQGYVQEHPSGLYLLSAASEGLVLPDEVAESRVGTLFSVLDEAYEDLVVDLPRRLDQATAAVLDRSDLILMLAQQTVAHLQELKRLASLLRNELGIAPNRLMVLVNRYQKRTGVTLRDFSEALPGLHIETLPNDFDTVSESINLGIPLLDLAPRSALCKKLKGVMDAVADAEATDLPRRPGRWGWLPAARG